MSLGMTMTEFLQNTRTATEVIIDLINKLNGQTILLDHLNSMSQYYGRQKAVLHKFEDEDVRIKNLAEEMVDLGKEKTEERKQMIRDIAVNGSVEYLSQSLLQIARHGIVSVHGGKAKCKNKVSLWNIGSSSQDIVEVIWEGRNQSIHFEDPSNFRNPVKNCFNDLKKYHKNLELYDKKRNMAFVIIELLGWNGEEGYSTFEDTMLKLA
ncbi:hypothetical protein [Bacillus cereus]|uniref:hypothetical protein n=1 Tax=Bacillus cereus TaxID=1396 RepID=UPI000BF680BF|nr:hypothetical protein [Bacillus cereus]PEV55382.1 hypothetical protein CN422_24905 [Bacillus cereus]PGU53266.1 hypothetical protein COD72_19370 [Bacillus cereus]